MSQERRVALSGHQVSEGCHRHVVKNAPSSQGDITTRSMALSDVFRMAILIPLKTGNHFLTIAGKPRQIFYYAIRFSARGNSIDFSTFFFMALWDVLLPHAQVQVLPTVALT